MSIARQIVNEPAAEPKSSRPARKVSPPNGEERWRPAGNLAFQRSLREAAELKLNPSRAAAEQEANQVADGSQSLWPKSPPTSTLDESSLAAQLVQRSINTTTASAAPLPAQIQRRMEQKLGTDLSSVRIHSDAKANALANSIGANAFTHGNDLYFNKDRYDPQSKEGQRLLAHELTHVAQQSGNASSEIQCDLMMSLPTALGAFEIDMATRGAPDVPGMEGHIRFLPDSTGPYSTQIGLVQIANVTDVAGASTAAGSPWNYAGSPEAGRMDLMTTGLLGAPRGWFVDTITATSPRGSALNPDYLAAAGVSVGDNEYGWLRSPTDVHATSLYDYPAFAGEVDYDFETVAKATDTQTIYGSLAWGFEIRSG